MSLNLKSSGGGSVTVDVPSTASNYTATLPAANGTVQVSGNQPAFSVALATNQSVTASTFTKLAFATEDFDTNSNFDTSTYRFTPTIAGYYQFTLAIAPATAVTSMTAFIYKNGALLRAGYQTSSSALGLYSIVTALVYLNGSTDYVEGYGYFQGTSPVVNSSSVYTYFQGCLVRAA